MERRPIFSNDSKPLDERRVAQEAYNPLKIAIEVVGLLNTAIDEPVQFKKNTRGREQPPNPFDDDRFCSQIKRLTDEFARTTESSTEAVGHILNLIDYDVAHEDYAAARKKIADISIFFMDQTKNYMKRKYPW